MFWDQDYRQAEWTSHCDPKDLLSSIMQNYFPIIVYKPWPLKYIALAIFFEKYTKHPIFLHLRARAEANIYPFPLKSDHRPCISGQNANSGPLCGSGLLFICQKRFCLASPFYAAFWQYRRYTSPGYVGAGIGIIKTFMVDVVMFLCKF